MFKNEFGSYCVQWALGGLILVALASSEFSGAGTIAALPVSALAATLTAIADISSNSNDVIRRRKLGDLLIFFAIWLNLLEYITSAATCARMASATIDYMTRGHLRDWLFGIESHSLGEPWPDVMGLLIIAVTVGFFMLGLEKSELFSFLLCFGIVVSFILFIIVGSISVDMKFWNWTEDFNLSGPKFILPTAALCSYAFPNSFPKSFKKLSCLKYASFVMVPLISYIVIIFLFTSISHFREIAGTSIPLVRVFEVRGVKWAVTVMAVCTIFVVCIALTEVIPLAYSLILRLAGKEWKILIPSLLYRNSETGALVLAIFITGSLISTLAFACPLFYLVRLMNVCNLSKCTFQSINTLYLLYKASYVCEKPSVYSTNVRYEKLGRNSQRKIKTRTPAQKLKTSLDVLPRLFRQTASNMNGKSKKLNKQEDSEDKENLLLNDYQIRDNENIYSESGSEGRCSPNGSDAEDSSTSTDIDSVVQEYKQKIQVTSLNNISERSTTTSSSRTAFVLVMIACVCSVVISVGLFQTQFLLVYIGATATLFVSCCLNLLPQNRSEDIKTHLINRKLLSCAAISSVIVNVVLSTVLLFDVWHGFVFWMLSGIVLFCRCDCCSCEGLYPANSERVRITSSKFNNLEEVDYEDFVFIPT